MNTLENSLRCLRHPATFISIVLLLLNDHVFKLLYPSWATGKLSDFAGLFFFPFVMAAALGLGTVRPHYSVRRTGWVAFGLTGILFALIKTTPWGNGFTQDVVSMLLGFRVQIILDPTDLIALLALLPAWRLWDRVEASHPRPVAWGALALAALATVATSPPIPIPRVMHVASADGIVYAELATADYNKGNTYAQSQDGGQTWGQGMNVPRGIFQEKTQSVVLCDPNRASLCFRIAQKSQVDESDDGGKTWRVGWQTGRDEYILQSCGFFGCGGRSGAWGPYDLSFHDQNGANTLIVAMGEEGVLVRTADGNWQRYGVLDATPSPLQATNLGEAFAAVFGETLTLFAISVIFVPIVFFGAWLVVLVRIAAPGRRLWAMLPILIALAIAVLGFYLQQVGGPLVLNTLSLVWLLSLGIGYVLACKRLETLAAQPTKRLTGRGVLAALLIFPMGLLPLLLWAFGFIASYGVAQLMALLFALVALAFALFVAISTATTASAQTDEG
jgi:hypothetical protein